MRVRWLLPVLALVALAGTATATHDPLTVPALDEPPVQDALGWLEEKRVTSEGCVHDAYDEDCYVQRTKWVAVSLAHAGVDPDRWPSPEASTMDWLRERADDLRDENLESCEENATTSGECADERIFSLTKSILAFEGAGDDARAVTLPDGGERDLAEELLDEHGGTEFGRADQVNDDIWALVALNSVGYEGPEVEDALDRIEQAQNADGGVGYRYDVGSSVDMTASAIMAAAPHDRQAFLEDARDYLADAQTTDGDRRACWAISTGAEPNTESTAWALQAVAALGEDPVQWSIDGQSPQQCLVTFQSDEGAFRHSEGSKLEFMPTQQALAALSWRPYGVADGPTGLLEVTDAATVDEEHTAEVPGARLRIGDQAVDQHSWTPEETGERVFHGFELDPPRPVQLTVNVQEAEASSSGSSSSSSSGSSSSGGSGDSDDGRPPEVELAAPARAERNVSFTVNASASPTDAPVTGFRLQAGQRPPTDWQPAATFEVELAQLGEQPVQAWARDAEGHVSEPASATVEVVDATPRLEVTGPALVNRSTPTSFEALVEDPDGPSPNVTWTGPQGDRANGSTATFAFQDRGEHTLEAQATDRAGNTANASWTVHARNRAPANLTVHPGQLEANATETVRAEAQDPEGDPLEVAWQRPGEPGSRSWGSQRHVETGAPGEHVLLVNVSDPYGGWTQARLVLPIRETPEEDRDPALETLATRTSGTTEPTSRPTRSPDPATVELPDAITAQANRSRLLKAQAHSPNGAVLNVTVELGGPLPTRGTDEVTALLPELPPGEYELAARAADRAGWGPWSNATLVVEPAPEQPQLLATEGPPAERSTPMGAVFALAALAVAAGRRTP